MRAGVNISDLGQFNSQVVFHTLRQLGVASITEIAERSGLSLQTVSALARQLISSGFIKEVGTMSVGRGRPRILLEIDASSRYSIGILVDPSRMTVALLNLAGEIEIIRSSEEIDPYDATGTVTRLSEVTKSIVEDSGVSWEKIAGVGMAVPGPIDDRSQSLSETLWLPGWTNYTPGQEFASRLQIRHVPLVKDTLAAVTGENWVRVNDLSDSTMVYVYLGTGTGIGLSHRGDAFPGSSGNAGEVGRALVALSREGGVPGRGIENDPAILVSQAIERGVLDGPEPNQHRLAEVDVMFRRLCSEADRGDAVAVELLNRAGHRIAGLAVLATELLDADEVVLGGPYWDIVKPWYLPAVQESFAQPSARAPHSVTISSSTMGANVAAVGAGAVVLDSLFVPRAPFVSPITGA